MTGFFNPKTPREKEIVFIKTWALSKKRVEEGHSPMELLRFSDRARRAFLYFALGEFSIENVLFVFIVDEYKKAPTYENADSIFGSFFGGAY